MIGRNSRVPPGPDWTLLFVRRRRRSEWPLTLNGPGSQLTLHLLFCSLVYFYYITLSVYFWSRPLLFSASFPRLEFFFHRPKRHSCSCRLRAILTFESVKNSKENETFIKFSMNLDDLQCYVCHCSLFFIPIHKSDFTAQLFLLFAVV